MIIVQLIPVLLNTESYKWDTIDTELRMIPVNN